MITITWYPDDTTTIGGGLTSLVLGASNRGIDEHDFRLNGKAATETAELFRATTVANFYRYNQRLSLSFKVIRDQDFSFKTFPDGESAFAFAALHLGAAPGYAIKGTGVLGFLIQTPATSFKLQFNGAVMESVDLSEWVGLALTFEYHFICTGAST